MHKTLHRSWIRLVYGLAAVVLLGGCLGTDKPKRFTEATQLMSPGYWQACMAIEGKTGYSCVTWKVRVEKDGLVVANQRATSKGGREDVFELEATRLGPDLFMFQRLMRKDEGSKGPHELAIYGFARVFHKEIDAVLPNCRAEALAPILAARGLAANPDPCRMTSTQYSQADTGAIMRAYAAMENVPVMFRYRLSKLEDKDGAERWAQEKP